MRRKIIKQKPAQAANEDANEPNKDETLSPTITNGTNGVVKTRRSAAAAAAAAISAAISEKDDVENENEAETKPVESKDETEDTETNVNNKTPSKVIKAKKRVASKSPNTKNKAKAIKNDYEEDAVESKEKSGENGECSINGEENLNDSKASNQRGANSSSAESSRLNDRSYSFETSMTDEDDGETDDENKPSKKNTSTMSESEKEKLRRRLPMSVKELIDYHSSNGKSIKEIVDRINQVCRSDEKVSYGYVQKYLYRKKLEATTAKKARYYRKKYGFVYRRMRRKPVLTDNHRACRIQWCETHKDDNFNKDIFIGKTALKPFLASLNQLKGSAPDPNQPRAQTTLHLWGAISRKGASPLQIFDGALTTAMYLEILLENVVPFIAENFPEGHRFHQDNNPKHSAKLSQEFLESTGINWVKTPPRSHDLNPIELVWTDLIQVVAKRLPKTIGQVVVAVKDYWKTLTPEKCSEFIDKLVETVPKVVEKNGEWVSLS